MKRLAILMCWLIIGATLASVSFISQPSRADAGGLPCYLCHGVNFEGSDIAPRVAGTKLTDGEILKQVHSPRGMMPAFNDGGWPDDATIIERIRAERPGKPTMVLSAHDRSAALATISAVAAARATTVLQSASSGAANAEAATPAPMPTRAAATATESGSLDHARPDSASTPAPWGFVMMLGGLLLALIGVLWVWRQP